MQYCHFKSPIGEIMLAGTEAGLSVVGFPKGKMARQPLAGWQFQPKSFAACMQQLDEYFSGSRQYFDVPYILQGTEFQTAVLKCVAEIPYGSTASYSTIANQINNPKAVRAVGLANATNNLPIIIPCHRIIGKNGTLTGFGGGLDTKKYLLELESRNSSKNVSYNFFN